MSERRTVRRPRHRHCTKGKFCSSPVLSYYSPWDALSTVDPQVSDAPQRGSPRTRCSRQKFQQGTIRKKKSRSHFQTIWPGTQQIGRHPSSMKGGWPSRSGNVWDNAAMESFFSSLKTERTGRKTYRTRDEARADVFDYIERFYNLKRRHSTIGFVSPMEFERQVGLA
jgi:putative transposase